MSVSPEVLDLIENEERILAEVISSLQDQLAYSSVQLDRENQRARDLTSRIVASRRDVDKQMLASDEAVSHQLKDTKSQEIQGLEKLLDTPYFARIELKEERGGKKQLIEYKLGIASNIDCRIIDWRKAPIAKLYYNYQEGDEYSELIQGRERDGVVCIRHKLEIRDGKLLRISCRHGNFIRRDNGWEALGSNYRSRSASGGYGELPNILSLITPEQFDLITREATTPVLIQGIAGSGKTTVALHRLAWLLHGENSDLKPEECVVIVLSKGLKNYVSSTLPGIGISGVKSMTFTQWALQMLPKIIGQETIRRPDYPPPPTVRRVKRSMALLLALEEYASITPPDKLFGDQRDIVAVLNRPEAVLKHDETGLLDREIISQASQYTSECFQEGLIDRSDDALLLRLCQLRTGSLIETKATRSIYRHIVADEVQDLSAAELAVIISAVEKTQQLTLVGDIGQTTSQSPSFPGWDKLRKHWSLGDSISDVISLTVSHRSTYPIMKLADFVSGSRRTTEGRKGKAPLWIKCRREGEGIRQVLGWLERVMERYPGTIIAVICRTAEEAKHTVSLLQPTYNEAVSLGDEDSFSLDEGIIVSNVLEFRGLEFPHVMIWNPSKRDYPDTSRARNLLYIAVSRAEENLCLTTWDRPSPLLPHPHSKLIRLYEPEADEEEETEETGND